MKRLLTFLAGCLFATAAHAQLTLLGVENGSKAGGYKGPLDAYNVSTLSCAGFMACSHAIAAAGTQQLVSMIRLSDDDFCDVLVKNDGTGTPGNVANCHTPANNGTAFLTWCGGNCEGYNNGFWYDQSGNNNPFLMNYAGVPPFSTSCSLGQNYCFTSANGMIYINCTFCGTTGPYTVAVVTRRTGSFTTEQAAMGFLDHSNGYLTLEFTSSANTVGISSTSEFTASATDNVQHVIVATFNGASSGLNIDGVDTTGNIGAAPGSANDIAVMAQNVNNVLQLTGQISAFVIYDSAANATQRGAICHALYLDYGTPNAC